MTYPVFSASFVKHFPDSQWISCGDVPGWFATDDQCRGMELVPMAGFAVVRSTEELMADRRQHVFTSSSLTMHDLYDLIAVIILCNKLSPEQKATCMMHLAHHVCVLYPIAANNGSNKE